MSLKLGEKGVLALAVLLMALALPRAAWAQSQEARQRVEEERRQTFDDFLRVQDALDEGFFYDYGGWIRGTFFEFEDSTDEEISIRDFDLRLYLDLRYDKTHQVYIRTKTINTDYSTGDAPDGDDDDLAGMDLDQGFYRLNLHELFDLDNFESKLIVGRQFLRLGDGFVFNRVNDGIYWDLRHRLFALELSGSKSIRSGADHDGSRPKQEDSKRNFFSGQFTWNGFQKHQPFVYVLVQRDQNNDADLALINQHFDYDTEHYGIGMDGELITNLKYHVEYIKQTGESYCTLGTCKTDIDAWAFEAKANYIFDFLWFNPRVNIGFLSGSGDEDARSISNTLGGNLGGTDDERFIEFGYTDTGYALAPRVSNLNIFTFGWSTKPLQKWKWFKDFQTGSQIYVYRKKEADSVISDPAAVFQDKEVGWEWDTFVNWRIFTDLSLNMQYGTFYPGDAYLQDNTRRYFSMSVTFTF